MDYDPMLSVRNFGEMTARTPKKGWSPMRNARGRGVQGGVEYPDEMGVTKEWDWSGEV